MYMEFWYENFPISLREGFSHLCRYKGWTISDRGVPLSVDVRPGAPLTVTGTQHGLHITAPDRAACFREIGLGVLQYQQGRTTFTLQETRQFAHAGVMFDHSRNGVLTLERQKELLCVMALMGLDVYYPYMEDVYTLPQEPLFGYMRGRLGADELKELDDFAYALGIEVVPCIQTLAHLNQFLQWDQPAKAYLDLDDILLVGSEKTDALIDSMMQFFSQTLRSRRIHVGMDEAYHLGRGRYADQNGLQKKTDIMRRHLQRVMEKAHEHGLSVMMWDDMFTGSYHPLDGQAVSIPDGAQLVYWDYYHEKPGEYAQNFAFRQKLCSDLVFAGGAWRWEGPAPHHNKTLVTTESALQEAKKAGLREVMVTSWGDDGSECPPDASYLGMQLFAEHTFSPTVSREQLNERLTFCTGLSLSAMLAQQNVTRLPGHEQDTAPYTLYKTLLYQDPLCGLYEEHVRSLKSRYDLSSYYAACAKAIRDEDYQNTTPTLQASAAYYRAVCVALSKKWDLGLCLLDAYRAGDREGLAHLLHERLPAAHQAMETLRLCAETMWMQNYKPFGLEVLTLRLAAVSARLQTAQRRLESYLSGQIDSLPELEEERIRFLPRDEETPNSFGRSYTAARLSW